MDPLQYKKATGLYLLKNLAAPPQHGEVSITCKKEWHEGRHSQRLAVNYSDEAKLVACWKTILLI